MSSKKHEGGDADRAERPPLAVRLATAFGASWASSTIRKEAFRLLTRRPYQVPDEMTHAPRQIRHARSPSRACSTIASEAMFAEFRDELDERRLRRHPPDPRLRLPLRPRGGHAPDRARRACAGMTKQSVGEIVDDLVALGYVERIPDPADRRAKLICLTERGEEAQRRPRPLRQGRAALGRALRRAAHRRSCASCSRRSPPTEPPPRCPSSPRQRSPARAASSARLSGQRAEAVVVEVEVGAAPGDLERRRGAERRVAVAVEVVAVGGRRRCPGRRPGGRGGASIVSK